VGLIHRIDTKTSFDTLTVIGFNQERKKGKEKEKGGKKREEKEGLGSETRVQHRQF